MIERLALLVLLVGCSRETAPRVVHAEYAGSASCQECHPAAFGAWQKSNHGLAERELAPADKLPAHDERPERVIGNDPLRQFLVRRDGGRLQVLQDSYDPKRDEWFDVYAGENRKPGEWGHWTGRGMNWNSMCATCHNVRVQKNYDEAADRYGTSMVELGVGCESCHGPSREHVRWERDHPGSKQLDPTSRKLDTEQIFATCGSCHARRGELTGDFVPGDAFDDEFQLTLVDGSETYYPDGQVHEEDYEYAAFLGSRMHQKGVRCVDCHDPHAAKVRLPGNLMCMFCHGGKKDVPLIDPATHGKHALDPLYTKPGGPDASGLAARKPEEIAALGGECVNCHMPQTFYMQRHRRHDHGFTIPDPQLTKEQGVPNACNRCHKDKSTDWAIEWTAKWYGAKPRPSRERARVVADARRGDAQALPGLLALLSKDESAYWRAVGAGLLGPWSRVREVREALLRATHDPSPLVRSESATALEQLPDSSPEALAALRALLDDPVRVVRVRAAWALRASVEPDSPAGKELARALAVTADQPTGQMRLGALALARSQPDAARAHYAKAVEWDSASAATRREYSIVLSMLQRPKEAREQLEAACKLEPGNAEWRYLLGLACYEAGDLEHTLDALHSAVELDPRHERAWYNLALAFDEAGLGAQALDALDHAAQLDPGDQRVSQARAAIEAKQAPR